ncbi:MAG: hypothetical protein HYV20_01105 [Gemmatimonadetes bacterium]|nr:hypothetical protein [Gemmatimonadota bacterium]
MRRHGPIGLGTAVFALAIGHAPADAQRWQVDASGTRVHFDTLSALHSASLAPLLEWQRGITYATLSSGLTGFERSQLSMQGRGDLSLLLNPFSPLSPVRLEVVGIAGGTYHSSNFRTAMTRGEGRLHVVGRHVGGWLGGVAATGWTSHEASLAVARGPTAGLWGRYARTRVAALFTPLWFQGSWFPEVEGRLSATAGPLDLVGYGGWRHGPAGSGVDAASWGGASAAWWLVNQAAVVLIGGSYAPDLLQGLPGGRYLSLAVRVTRRRPAEPSIKPLGRPVYGKTDGAGWLRFGIPGAVRVELVGDWTNWQPVAMQRAPDGTWELRMTLAPGVYRFNLVVNGDRWIVPKGVATVDDGFGGETGVLIVP